MPRCRQLPSYLSHFLAQPWEAVLSTTNPSGLPQQTVMWYAHMSDHILMTCLEKRKKVRNLKRDSKASALIFGPGCYVAIAGKIGVLKDRIEAQNNIEMLLHRYDSMQMLEKLTHPDRVTLKLYPRQYHSHRVKSWLAKQELQTPQSASNSSPK